MEKIHIALATNDNYIQHAGVMITSLLYNKKTKNPIVIHVLGNKLSEASLDKLGEIVKKYNDAYINFYVVDAGLFEGLFSGSQPGGDRTTYFKTVIPEVLSGEIKKALYIDVDMVIRKDIMELWDTDIDNYHLAAVEDYPGKPIGILPLLKSNLGIPKNESYFNAGLLLINLDKWREDSIGRKVIEFNKNNPDKLTFTDQDGFNAILWGKWLQLNPKWNVMGIPFRSWEKNKLDSEIIESEKDPSIVHFGGGKRNRPWNYGCINPYSKEYWKYLETTPWRGYSVIQPNKLKYWSGILYEHFKVLIIRLGQYNNVIKIKKLLRKI